MGYVGRDVEQIIRDLLEIAIGGTREKLKRQVTVKAETQAEERLLDALVGDTASADTRQKFRKRLREGDLDDKEVDIEVADTQPNGGMPSFDIPGMPGASMGMINLSDMLGKAFGGNRTKSRRLNVREAYDILVAEESENLLDNEAVVRDAIWAVENNGIVFLDEIDKICARSSENQSNSGISREGVQRDLLPLIEGTTVSTKHGNVKTDHILFIASGAFHLAKPSDLLPELQGRLPIRVELQPLTRADFVRILTEPEASLIRQYEALLATEGVKLHFEPEAIDALADVAAEVNQSVENIGARRLHTVLERLLDDISFTAPDMPPGSEVTITAQLVQERVAGLTAKADLAKFIL